MEGGELSLGPEAESIEPRSPDWILSANAVLLDVFQTVLAVDWAAVTSALVAGSVFPKTVWESALRNHGHALMTGDITMAEVFVRMFQTVGERPTNIDDLVRLDRDVLWRYSTVYRDVVPFIDRLRRHGRKIAFISNCAMNTEPLLERLDLTRRVDHVALSCRVGFVKPDAAIYRSALQAVDADATDSVLVDDQAAYCDGARVIGMSAVQIDRDRVLPDLLHSLDDFTVT